MCAKQGTGAQRQTDELHIVRFSKFFTKLTSSSDEIAYRQNDISSVHLTRCETDEILISSDEHAYRQFVLPKILKFLILFN